MTFRDQEKERYRELKSEVFSNGAQREGTYKGTPHFFCLADRCASENLYKGIRRPAIRYFLSRDIPWHDGVCDARIPSNHLCCSQSCCINFLFHTSTRPELIKNVFGHFYPDLKEPLSIPMDLDGPAIDDRPHYVAFEWFGSHDFLREGERKGYARTRGANYTSADFAFRFRRTDGKIHLVLGEWKYTEFYNSEDLGAIPARKDNYRRAFERPDGVFSKGIKAYGSRLYDAMFYEPFYQLMRLQLLAQEMAHGADTGVGREMDADVVTVLHVCPTANQEFRNRVTSPALKSMFPNKNVFEIWDELVPKGSFMSIATENLLDQIPRGASGRDSDAWVDYLKLRYGWVSGPASAHPL